MTDKKKRWIFWRVIGCACFFVAAVMAGMAGRTWLAYRGSEEYLQHMYQDIERIALEAESSQEGDSAFFGTGNLPGTGRLGKDQSGLEKSGQKIPGQAKTDPQKQESSTIRNLDIESLKKLNPDVAGWIQIPGTVIDYPVMHTPNDPNYYFNRDFYGRKSAYGMIYFDGTCAPDGGSQNLLIYGHHMRNGTMFASIEKYQSPAYRKNHPVICLTGGNGREEYEVMAAVRVAADRIDEDLMRMLWAGNEEQFARLMEFVGDNALYDSGINARWPDRLITLTTCEYTQRDGRFFLIARKRMQEGDRP